MITLKKEECLLLMIDIQPSLFNAVVDNKDLETNCKLLLELHKVLSLPLLVTTQNAEKLGRTIESLAKRFAPDQTVFDKMTFDAIATETIDDAVRDSRKKTIILFGLETHVCIYQTAVHCLTQAYSLIVVSDAVSSRTIANRDAGLQAIARAGGKIMSTEMLIYGLLEKAGTPEFRSMLPFLKDPQGLN